MSNLGEAPWEAPGHPAHPNRRKSEVPATARDGGGGEWVRRGDEGKACGPESRRSAQSFTFK